MPGTMNRWLRVACLVIATVALMLTACNDDDDSDGPGPTNAPQQAQPSPTVATQANVCLTNPAPATNNNQPTQFGYRVVTAPAANATMQSPLTIQGQANPFEGAFGATLYNASGAPIATQDYNKSNLQLGFSVQLTFSVSSSTPACLWVFERSGNTGSPINVTQIPVTLSP
jgi:hypothetical protein